MSEVIPEDEDRGGEGAIGGGTSADEPEDEQAGLDPDDGGPGSQNM
jgi:hypothetical protein